MKGRTYRYFTGEPLYPFGYGLSYTTFAYSKLHVPSKVKPGQPVTVSVEVENTGSVAGEEVAELYVANPGANWPVPIRSLAGFQRILLKPHEHRTLSFAVAPKQLAPGMRTISVGGSSTGAVTAPLRVAD